MDFLSKIQLNPDFKFPKCGAETQPDGVRDSVPDGVHLLATYWLVFNKLFPGVSVCLSL